MSPLTRRAATVWLKLWVLTVAVSKSGLAICFIKRSPLTVWRLIVLVCYQILPQQPLIHGPLLTGFKLAYPALSWFSASASSTDGFISRVEAPFIDVAGSPANTYQLSPQI